MTATCFSVPSGSRTLRLVHLRDRGGGDRRPELGVKLVDRRAERLLDRRARLALREGRQAILEGGQIAGELAADDVVAGGEELAELDVGRPERGERFGEAWSRCRRRRRSCGAAP